MMNRGRLAKNGSKIELVANGGVFGRMIECTDCLGTGCTTCNSQGVLHEAWQPVNAQQRELPWPVLNTPKNTDNP